MVKELGLLCGGLSRAPSDVGLLSSIMVKRHRGSRKGDDQDLRNYTFSLALQQSLGVNFALAMNHFAMDHFATDAFGRLRKDRTLVRLLRRRPKACVAKWFIAKWFIASAKLTPEDC